MLPERLLRFVVEGSEALPSYLTAADHAWLRTLVEEFQRFDGLRVERLRERLREPLPCTAPEGKVALASHVLERLCAVERPESPVPPRRARRALFREGQRQRDGGSPWSRGVAVSTAAAALGVDDGALLASLFADLPAERLLRVPAPPPAAHDLALRINLALAQGFLQRAARVRVALWGNARAVVRQILLRRLLCAVYPARGSAGAEIEISGPYSLFRRTILYGRALSSLVPALRGCDRFRLGAEVELRGRLLRVRLQSGDPIFPAAELPRRYDSRLEERFSLDLRRLAPELDLVREPHPLRAGRQLVFPDFAIFRRRDPSRRVLVEIVGFWTPDYLERKLRCLRAARVPNLLLCIDETLACGADGIRRDFPHVVPFRRRIDAAAVLERVEALLQGQNSPASTPRT